MDVYEILGEASNKIQALVPIRRVEMFSGKVYCCCYLSESIRVIASHL